MWSALPVLAFAFTAQIAADQPPLALLEHEDPYTGVTGLSSYLEEHGLPFARLGPGRPLDRRGLRAVVIGAFATASPSNRRWLADNLDHLRHFVRRGGMVVALAQADQDEEHPGWLGPELHASRGDREAEGLTVATPAHALFRRRFRIGAADLQRLEVGDVPGAMARDVAAGHDLFRSQKGFAVLARTEDGAPAVLHGRSGRGQVLLVQLAPDKVYDLPPGPAAARSATHLLANLIGLCLEPGPPPTPSPAVEPAPSQTAAGRVFWDENGDGRLDAREKPASGVTVFLGQNRVRTDRQGRFSLKLRADRSARLGVNPPAAARASPSVLVRGWEPIARDLALPLRREPLRGQARFSFVALADLHLMSGSLDKQRARLAVRLARLARDRPAFGLLLGDNAATSRTAEHGAVRKLLDTAPFPLFTLPGNHDETLGPDRLDRYRAQVEAPFFSFDWGRVHFVLGRDFNPPAARAWLSADLAGVPEEKVVVLCQHEPPGARLLARLRRAPVRVLMHGHLHRSDKRTHGRLEQFTLPPALFGGLDRSPSGYAVFTVDGTKIHGEIRGWSEVGATTAQKQGPRPVWTRDLGGQVRAPPAENQGRLYVPLAGDGQGGGSRGVAALRSADGQVVWTQETAAPVLARPAADGERIILQLEDGALLALQEDHGRLIWRRGPPRDRAEGFFLAPPALDARGVFRTAPAAPALLGQEGGKVRWQAASLGTAAIPSFTGGHLSAELLLVTSARHGLVALDADRGTQRWATEPFTATAPPAGDGDRAYAASASELHAFDMASGLELWTAPLPFAIHSAPPVATGEMVLMATGRGVLVALDAETGAERWRVESDPALAEIGPYRRGGPSAGAPPAVSGATALFGTDDGRLRAIRISDGAVTWSIALGAPVTGCALSGMRYFATLLPGRVAAFEAPGPIRTEP